jgi:Transglutaminase-like superfamily
VVSRLLPTYVLLSLLKHLVPLRWLAEWVWCSPAGPRNREAERRLIISVLRISRLVGLPDRDCLQRSLLLYRVLSRAGADPTLVVGFAPTNDGMLGHAWIMVDGRSIIECEHNLLRFSPALAFGFQGALRSGS